MDGILTHSPPVVYSHPWYGHCARPSTSFPRLSGHALCAHSSLTHPAAPSPSLNMTHGTLKRSNGTMVASSRPLAKATGNQCARSAPVPVRNFSSICAGGIDGIANSSFRMARVRAVDGYSAGASMEDEASAVAPEPSPGRSVLLIATSPRCPFPSFRLADVALLLDAAPRLRDCARILRPWVFCATTPIREALAALMLAPAALIATRESAMGT